MSQSSPRLDLPFIQAAQAQKHVTHNEAVEKLDLLTQLVVEDFTQTVPPTSATEGQAWAIPVGATGAWTGRAGQIASWRGGGWLYATPDQGWRAWGTLSGDFRVYDGTSWVVLPASVDFDNLAGVGVNATSDATNRLAVAAPATLLTHEGSGHQVKINKASAGDTASLLYQTGWSGRAEMGTAGNDDFSVKVSADGATWVEAQRIDATTGITTMQAVTGDVIDVAPDTVGTLTPPSSAGAALITVFDATGGQLSHGGLVMFDVGTPGMILLGGGADLEDLGAVPLTGASGTPGRSGVAADTGVLQIVNRTGATLSYTVTVLGGLAGR